MTKQVVPEGASTGPFTVHIDCQDTEPVGSPGGDSPVEGESEQSESTESESTESESPDLTPDVSAQETDDLVFNGPGTQLSESFFDETTCIITEPNSAGALRVTFACTGVSPAEFADEVTCTNIPNGLQIVIGDLGGGIDDQVTIDILVINDFTVAADPAAVVVAGPTFTG